MKHDPKRWTTEWKKHMNSQEVRESHKELLEKLKLRNNKKRREMDERARS